MGCRSLEIDCISRSMYPTISVHQKDFQLSVVKCGELRVGSRVWTGDASGEAARGRRDESAASRSSFVNSLACQSEKPDSSARVRIQNTRVCLQATRVEQSPRLL